MLRIRLTNSDFGIYEVPSKEHSSLTGSSVTLRQKTDTGSTAYGFSGEIEFTNEAYRLIESQLILPLDAGTREIGFELYDDCCGGTLLFLGTIDQGSLEWCNGVCSVKASIVESSRIAQALKCIQSTYIWKDPAYDVALKAYKAANREKKADEVRDYIEAQLQANPNNWPGDFKKKEHPFLLYCAYSKPALTQDLLIFLVLTLNVIVSALLFLTTVTLGIIFGILNLIPGVNVTQDDVPGLAQLRDLLRSINRSAFNCGKGHAAPLARDYIINACNQCGLTFSSSILNNASSPYHNTIILSAPVTQGSFDYFRWDDSNKPLLTLSAFLDELKKVFNGDYYIQGNTLVFERRDFFTSNDLWIDASQGLDNPDIFKLCFSYSKKTVPAYGNFLYLEDTLESIGNEAKWAYNDIVEWNTGNNKNQKGELRVQLDYAPQRYRGDHVNDDPFGNAWLTSVKVLNALFSAFLGNSPLQTLIDVVENPDTENVILLEKELAFVKKIIVWDGVELKKAKAVRKPVGTTDRSYFNTPYWFAEANNPIESVKPPYTEIGVPNLYDNFYAIEAPQGLPFKGISYELIVERSCTLIEEFKFGKYVLLPQGPGTVDEVEIAEKQIRIKGFV